MVSDAKVRPDLCFSLKHVVTYLNFTHYLAWFIWNTYILYTAALKTSAERKKYSLVSATE